MDTIATLEQLAESTGGLLISHTNDVRAGIARAVGDLRGYYEVAYSPAEPRVRRPLPQDRAQGDPPGRQRADPQRLLRDAARARARRRSRTRCSCSRPCASPDPPHDLPVRTPRVPLRPGGGRPALHGGPRAAARRDPVRAGQGPLLRARPLLVHGRAADALGRRRREVQPGRAALAAAQAPRRPEAGQRRLHALLHAARGALPPRDRGDRPAVGAHERRPEPAERAPGALAVRR